MPPKNVKDGWMEQDIIGGIVVAILLASVVVGTCLFYAYMEARTYRELTGKQATTWQALWVDLRVMDSVKQD